MKIESIALKGFIGIKKGLGLDSISLDLSGLSGLVALAGPNGRGKSSFLENLQPYRTLASRKRSLQHHVFLRDSSRDLTFHLNGDQYRTLIKIDSNSEKQEGFIWKNGSPQVNGKVREYDRYIEDLLGSEELFFASIFCAQNSRKLSDMTTGDLKKLFAEFLRLDLLIAYEQTAKQAGTVLNTRVFQINQETDRLRKAVEGKDRLQDLLMVQIEQNEEHTEMVGHYRFMLLESEKALISAREAATRNDGHRQRVKDLEEQKGKINEENMADLKATAALADKTEISINAVIDGINKCKAILSKKEAIQAAVEKEKTFKQNIENLTLELSEIQESMSTLTSSLHEREKALTNLRADLKSLTQAPEIKLLEGKLTSLKESVAALDLRDPACQSTTCRFIVSALEAQKQIPEIERSISEKKAAASSQIQGKKGEIAELEKSVKADNILHQEKSNRISAAKTTLTSAKAHLVQAEALAKDAPQMEITESRMADLIEKQEYLTAQVNSAKEGLIARREERGDKVIDLNLKIESVMKEIDHQADEKVKGLLGTITGIKDDIAKYEKKITDTLAQVATIEAKIKEIESHEKALIDAEDRQRRIVSEISEWSYLQIACGKKGIQALEIDSVAPLITGYANALLQKTFGPTFTVRFRTQDPETGKEVLDILVIREDGTEVLLDDLSGGEKVWVLKSLRLAMTLVSKQKSGKLFGTALADEEDGALDVENAQNFVHLYRAFMEQGDFGTAYFISHKPECVAMADHVLEFNRRGIEVE